MKKIHLLILTLLITTHTTVLAQDNEISVSTNLGNATLISNGGAEDFLTGNEFHSSNIYLSYFLTLKHHFPNNMALSLTAGFFSDKGDFSFRDRSESYEVGPYTRQSYIISPEFEVPYYTARNVSLYSIVGLGIRSSYADIQDLSHHSFSGGVHPVPHTITPAFQYTPIAVRVGNRIGGLAELGWGYKGIINLGLFCKI
ncbi:MAG: hypothetical protein JSS96_05875 [Bacteroidetes bacterium]|nr:hypothetical protein [Bacteroidota bacterium]